jgi:hypothetical protein
LVNGRYIQRHDTVCVELHCNMCGVMGGNCTADCCVAMCRNWYGKVSVLWNGQCELTELLVTVNWTVRTDRTVGKSKLDSMISGNRKGT